MSQRHVNLVAILTYFNPLMDFDSKSKQGDRLLAFFTFPLGSLLSCFRDKRAYG